MNNAKNITEKFPYIVIEGPIGSGKTTLARKLAERFSVNLLLEKAEDNPFLSRFYHDQARFALPTQLFFLFQRANQIKDLHQPDIFGDAAIADFFLEKDPLFARLNLNDDEFDLYRQIYDRMHLQASKPDLVIYLQTPVDALLTRVEQRNINYEQNIPREYLSRLSEAYSEFFHAYDSSPLLIVNNEKINITNSEEALDLLVDRIMQVQSRREFFNPNWD
jgi:deoxyadenosine/deoxycytidine kinase